MALSGYYGCLTESDIDVAYDECDAGMALFFGYYDDMVRLLKETPEDIPKVLSYIKGHYDAYPFFCKAFPEHRLVVLEILKSEIEEVKTRTPNDYELSIAPLEQWLSDWHTELLFLESMYAQL